LLKAASLFTAFNSSLTLVVHEKIMADKDINNNFFIIILVKVN